MTNTGTGDLIAYGATTGTRTELPAGVSHTFNWGTGGPANDLLDPTGWDVYREDNGSEIDVAGGTFTLAQYNAKCNATYTVTAQPVCVGATRGSTSPTPAPVMPTLSCHQHTATLTGAQSAWRAPWPMVGGEWFPEATWNAFRTDVDPFQRFEGGRFMLADVCGPPLTVPSAPQTLTATPGNGSVNLSWHAPADSGGSPITDYIVQRSANGPSNWLTVNDGISTTASAAVPGLTNGTLYYIRVRAVNAAGQGLDSTVVALPGRFLAHRGS